MPLNPAPLIESGMLLVTQELIRSDMSRAAVIDYALVCGAATLANYQDAVDDFQANFNATVQLMLDSEVSILPPTGRGGDGSNIPILVVAAGATVAGGHADTFLPPNCALLVKKRTAYGGKPNRGRTYLPFALSDASVSENGTVDPTYLAAQNVRFASFLTQLATDSTPMVVENKHFSTGIGGKPYVSSISSSPLVTSYVGESMIATQRRRLGR